MKVYIVLDIKNLHSDFVGCDEDDGTPDVKVYGVYRYERDASKAAHELIDQYHNHPHTKGECEGWQVTHSICVEVHELR